ncbi:uncharacterized protein LOC134287908 [Aedes albopictus]|uniref:Uncharacterized protein n=1 Tax=Aedes albopictus TaxID=7160 RepID=A0ABM1YXE0_AEDAL
MCPRICTICRNGASKLITHHLCECCSERFLKCGGTVTGSVDGSYLEQKPQLLDETKNTLGLHKCALCNDRQTYQESLYWKHVHVSFKPAFYERVTIKLSFW